MMTIRSLTTLDELEDVQQLERLVWSMEPIPTHQTSTAIKNGGMMIGAFDGDRLVGFNYGFPGFRDGVAYVCSHMMGIDPAYRSRGIGERLKRTQRERALELGYTMIHWTFDPLQTRNAYLNLTKLGGVCYTYYPNCYGEMKDGLNAGLPSDRFEISWHIASSHVADGFTLPDVARIPLGLYIEHDDGPELRLALPSSFNAACYTLPVLPNIDDVKANDPTLAMKWRMDVRNACMKLFAADYAIVSLERRDAYYEYVAVPRDTLHL